LQGKVEGQDGNKKIIAAEAAEATEVEADKNFLSAWEADSKESASCFL
jgi:hypothetical protein